MNTADFIARLNSLDIRLTVEDNRLRLNAPKGVLTPELRDELSGRKEEILAYLQANAQPQTTTSSPDRIAKIQPAVRSGALPLSFTQMRLWFLDQFDPGNTAYSIPMAIQMEGNLDKAILKRCLNEIVLRHESLRTTFGEDGNSQPAQVIQPFTAMDLPLQDLRGLPEADREQANLQYLRELSRLPFDLNNGPLFRANLIQLDDQLYCLFMNMHHIISDGWSTGILFAELGTLYQAFYNGQPSPLPGLTIQYPDYAAWQRQHLTPQALRPQLDFWKVALNSPLPILELPTDRPRPRFRTSKGSYKIQAIPAALAASLKQAASRHGVTLFILMEAAFNVLLYRYTGQSDIIVGTANANRSQQEIESLIGFFMNTLALRFHLSGNLTFTDLLAHVRDVSLDAFANREIPFEHIVEALHPDRDTSHTPVFQVMFILQNTPIQVMQLPSLKISPIYLENGTAKYDLTLTVVDMPETGMSCFFEYNTDLFEPGTILRMMGHYQAILEAVCANPALRIDEIPLLSPAEYQQLESWNDTGSPYPATSALPALFENQVDASPEAIAACDDDAQISFAELDIRANRLANYLLSLGIKQEALVGVCLPRSIDMLIALLAIQKAGAAYLPLDPNFPANRLEYMLQDSSTRILITHSSLEPILAASGVSMICLDVESTEISAQNPARPGACSGPENLAYVLYTSGSTGRPKGVQVLQRGLVNFLVSMQKEPGISSKDVLLSVTTLSFDIAGLELYLPLISGARLVIASSATTANGPLLLQALERNGVTLMQATPATWRLLLAAGWKGSPNFKILCGGEALPRDLAASLLERCGALWNLYGPTETTIWSTLSRIDTLEKPITIGRPIANTRVYILDRLGQRVPAGVPGEIFIGGDGLARGYLNRPELTAEKFIKNPLTADGTPRLYRTGDLGRFLNDGSIEFIGRADDQVKVRGFRIELGEIENVLAQHQSIRQAVVIVREDTPGDQRLAAYLTLLTSPAPSTSDLRGFLADKLPEYMIPGIYVFLDHLPLTPNGKVDRKALPMPESSRPELGTHFIAPRNEVEKTLASIWAEALKVEQVGIQDNFFELGGHSLLIVQVHHQITQQFHADLSIAQMFQYPTIQSLAQFLSRSQEQPPQQPGQNIRERAILQKEALERQRKQPRPGGHDS
jgi:amino acid adenylation domain-containing protein